MRAAQYRYSFTRANYLDTVLHRDRAGSTAQWDLLCDMKDALHNLRQKVLGAQDMPAYRDLVRSSFAPRLAAVGLSPRSGESPVVALDRLYLAQILVEEARDKATTDALAETATNYFEGKDGAPDLLQEAMRAGVLRDGRSFGDLLLAKFKISTDEYFRRGVIYALSGSEDEGLLAELLDLALTPAMRTGEFSYVTTFMQAEPTARPVLWNWFKTNYGAILARLSAPGMQRSPGILGDGCDAGAHAELEAFFRSKIVTLAGTPRTLALAEEQIERCIAFKEAKAQDLSEALRRAAH